MINNNSRVFCTKFFFIFDFDHIWKNNHSAIYVQKALKKFSLVVKSVYSQVSITFLACVAIFLQYLTCLGQQGLVYNSI